MATFQAQLQLLNVDAPIPVRNHKNKRKELATTMDGSDGHLTTTNQFPLRRLKLSIPGRAYAVTPSMPFRYLTHWVMLC
jgi:hypothetical protein